MLERQLLEVARQRPQIILDSTTGTMTLNAQAMSAVNDADLRHVTKLKLEVQRSKLSSIYIYTHTHTHTHTYILLCKLLIAFLTPLSSIPGTAPINFLARYDSTFSSMLTWRDAIPMPDWYYTQGGAAQAKAHWEGFNKYDRSERRRHGRVWKVNDRRKDNFSIAAARTRRCFRRHGCCTIC